PPISSRPRTSHNLSARRDELTSGTPSNDRLSVLLGGGNTLTDQDHLVGVEQVNWLALGGHVDHGTNRGNVGLVRVAFATLALTGLLCVSPALAAPRMTASDRQAIGVLLDRFGKEVGVRGGARAGGGA